MRSTRRSNNASPGQRLARDARALAAPRAALIGAGLLAAGLLARGVLPADALAAGAVASTASTAPPTLELDAAWGGYARPGSTTELRIRLQAPFSGRAKLRIRSGRAVIATAIALHPGVAAQLDIPVPVSERLGVEATLPGGGHLHRDLALRLTENPLIALSPGAAASLPEDLAHADTGANGYPRHAQAYEAVDAVALDGATLAHLDSRQLKALLTDIERCGPMLAVGLPAAAAALLRSNAGCNGRALQWLEDSTDIGSAAEALLASAPPPPVQPASLRSLLARASGAWPLLVAGLGLYAVGALLLAAFEAGAAALTGYAAAAALILWIAGHFASAAPRLAIWAESEPGDHWGRYAALAEFAGTGRARRTVALPPLLQGAQPCGGSDETNIEGAEGAPPPLWRWEAQAEHFTAVTLSERLFGSPAICWHGAFPLARRASLAREPHGSPRVTNLGGGAWPAGIAVVEDVAYALPPLAPRASAALTPLSASAAATAAALLAVQRAGGGGALLWPLDLPPLHLKQASVRAYLLEHVPADAEEAP